MTHHNRGFTLVELAIALTVIALLMAGVLMGSNVLIERSRTASLLSKIKDLAASSRNFKSRYGYFPGDMPNAGTYPRLSISHFADHE
jgi:prepilin-type N-terminal cleavage/methylation domain-containing protein